MENFEVFEELDIDIKKEDRTKKVFDFKPFDLNAPYIVFDIETTGLGSWDDILELSAITNTAEIIDEYFNAKRVKKWEKTEKIHHITKEMVKDKDCFYNRRDEFRRLFKNYSYIFGFNVDFDIKKLETTGYFYPRSSSVVIDVLNMWRVYKERNKINTLNDKLITVADYFGYNFESKAHNALEDTIATLFVLTEILKRDNDILLQVKNAKILKKETFKITLEPFKGETIFEIEKED